MTWPQAARAFHRAAPDEAGFGVTMPMPGLARSSHVLMFFGLPGRTAKTTMDEEMIPLFGPEFQLGSIRVGTSRVMSLCTEKCTMSAASPFWTARLWSPEAPYEVLNVTLLPSLNLAHSWTAALFAVSATE